MLKDFLIWLAMPLFRSEMLELQRYRNVVHDLHRYCASNEVADKVTSIIISHAAHDLPYTASAIRDSLTALERTKLPAKVGSVEFPEGTPNEEVLREAIHQHHVYNGHFKIKVEADNLSHLRQKTEPEVRPINFPIYSNQEVERGWRGTDWQDSGASSCSSDSSSSPSSDSSSSSSPSSDSSSSSCSSSSSSD